jgi:hypothetical protein
LVLAGRRRPRVRSLGCEKCAKCSTTIERRSTRSCDPGDGKQHDGHEHRARDRAERGPAGAPLAVSYAIPTFTGGAAEAAPEAYWSRLTHVAVPSDAP